MKKWLRILLALILLVVLVAIAYAVYLFADFSRLEDQLELVPALNADGELPADAALTAVSWNLGFGAYSADYSFFMDGGTQSRAYSRKACEDNILTAISSLEEMQPDLMLIQELDVDADRSYHLNQQEMLKAAFETSHSAVFAQNYDSSYLFYPFHQPIGASRSGILTLAKARIDGALRRSLPIEEGFYKFLDLDRCYSVSRIPVENGRELCLYNLHLSAYSSDGEIATKQLEILLGDMEAEYRAGNYVIAGGDFNKDLLGDSSDYTGVSGADYSWAQPFPVRLMPEGFVLADSLDAQNLVLSARNADMPYAKGTTFEIMLDGFIVSENVEILDCSVIDAGFRVSDHNPVRMEFKLK